MKAITCSVVICLLHLELAKAHAPYYGTGRQGMQRHGSGKGILGNAGDSRKMDGTGFTQQSAPMPSNTFSLTNATCGPVLPFLTPLASACLDVGKGSDVNNEQQRLAMIKWDIKLSSPSKHAFVALFDDEQQSFGSLWDASISCEDIKGAAKAIDGPFTSPASIRGFRDVKQAMSHEWLVAVVMCDVACPHVKKADITFWQATEESSEAACSSASEILRDAARDFKADMLQEWKDLSLESALSLAGVTRAGVVLLYCAFALFLCIAMWHLCGAMRHTGARAIYRHVSFFISAFVCLCYLAMASGAGVRPVFKANGGAWTYTQPPNMNLSDLLQAQERTSRAAKLFNPELSMPKVAAVFFLRPIIQLVLVQSSVKLLCLISGVSRGTSLFLLATSWLMLCCWAMQTLLLSPARYGFWAFGCLFLVCLIFSCLVYGRRASLRRKDHGSISKKAQDSFPKVFLVCICFWSMQPVVWLLSQGARVLGSTGEISIYFAVDILFMLSLSLLLAWNRSMDLPLPFWGSGSAYSEERQELLGEGRGVRDGLIVLSDDEEANKDE